MDFDPAKLEQSSRLGRFINWLFSYPVSRWWLGFFRLFTPAMRIPVPGAGCLAGRLVLRYDEVREVLERDREFPVPWGWKMVEVTGGAQGGLNFVLGMPRDETYRLSYQQLAEAFPLSDVKDYVIPRGRKDAEDIVARVAGQKFDAIEELITASPTRLCASYYGLHIPDEKMFAKWTLAISSFLFGPPFGKSAGEPDESRQLAAAAARLLRAVIRASIEAERERIKRGEPANGPVLRRLLDMQAKDQRITDDVIHAQLFGMVLGFIPTDVLAGGNVLETLLRQPEFLKRSRAAAIAGDDDLLWRCLRETLRFRNINPGPWRVTWGAGHVMNRGTRDEVSFAPGTPVLASSQAAMFDRRRVKRPYVFDPDRPDEDYLVFGVGQHWCVGAYIAIAQITQMFKPLLRREGLEAVGGMRRFTVFPLHMPVRFAK